jgi:hypothetical protein
VNTLIHNQKIKEMRNLANQLLRGEYYFGTGTRNTEQFDNFFNSFKRSFKRELNKINAKNLEVSKGHFYLSGFFTVQEQVIYFSISDVRGYLQTNWKGLPEMLIRKAKDYRDFSGGHNRYVAIEPNMSREILRVCNLDLNGFKKVESKKFDLQKKVDKIVSELKENNYFEGSVDSTNKAQRLIWRIGEALGHKGFCITETKAGRYKVRSFAKLEGFNARYETSSKRLYVETYLTDEQFLNKLATYEKSEIITNPYSGEKAELEPLAVALYDFIKGCEITNNYDNMRRALRIFAERWTREYYILLD